MVKGCERRVVHLKNTDSAMFEEAFFLLKDEKSEKPPSHTAMVREANRIIELNITRRSAYEEPAPFVSSLRQTVISFVLGSLLGSGIVLLVMTLL